MTMMMVMVIVMEVIMVMVRVMVRVLMMVMVMVINNSDDYDNGILDCRRLNIRRGGTFLQVSQVRVFFVDL